MQVAYQGGHFSIQGALSLPFIRISTTFMSKYLLSIWSNNKTHMQRCQGSSRKVT